MKANPWKDQLAMYYLSVGAIEVDREGRIWRVKDKRGGTKNKIWRDVKPRRLEFKTHKGYLRSEFRFNCHVYNIYNHRIVWLSHNGLIPDELEINHKNGIRDDNHPSNLELLTGSENVKHGFKVNGRMPMRGEKHGFAKLNEQEVIEIRQLYNSGNYSQISLAKMYGLSQTHISRVVNRKSWAHI